MEVVYYLSDPKAFIANIYKNWIKENGRLIVGLDFYKENTVSHSWPEDCGVSIMQLLPEATWIGFFKEAGFSNVQSWRVDVKENWAGTLVNCLAYFYPWYHRSVGLEIIQETAILGEDVSFVPNLDYFLQVALENKSGNLVAIPVAANGSGDLASLANTDAFIQLPKDTTEFKKGAVYPILKYR